MDPIVASGGSPTPRAGSRRGIGRGPLAILAVVCLLAGACSGPASSAGPVAGPGGRAQIAAVDLTGLSIGSAAGVSVGAVKKPVKPTVKIPAPPKAAATPAGSIDEQAAALAKAVKPGGRKALAPLLAAYRIAGIPVIGANGKPLPGFAADEVGPGWWQVWLSAGGKPSFAVSLADATKLLVAIPKAPSLDTTAMATAALADLRAMAVDTDPHVRFFARFLVDLSAARSGLDPLDPATGPEGVQLSPIAVEFFTAGALRNLAIASVRASRAAAISAGYGIASDATVAPGGPLSDATVAPGGLLSAAAAPPAANPCNPTGDLEVASYWTQWIASKISGGVNVFLMEKGLKSFIDMIIATPAWAEGAGKAAGWVGSAMSALTFYAELSSLKATVVVAPKPLVRTKHTSPAGDPGVVTATLSYDLKGSQLDGGTGIANCLLVFANAIGIQAAFPSDGAVSGAMLEFQGGNGFVQQIANASSFVRFSHPADQAIQATDANGKAVIDIEGMEQRREIPASVVGYTRTASIRVLAQPEEENARSIASMFWDSLVALQTGAIGAAAPIIDVLKTIRYDLGETSFPVTDWRTGWELKGSDGAGVTVHGLKCDTLDGDWVVEGDVNVPPSMTHIVYVITIPRGSLKGTYTYSGATTVPGAPVVTFLAPRGDATIEPRSDGSVWMTLQDTPETETVHDPDAPVTTTVTLPGPDWSWQPSSACGAPPGG
jgi:hypothetical protein